MTLFLFKLWANQIGGDPGLNAPKPVAAEFGEETNIVTVYCATERKPHAYVSNVMVSVMLFITVL